jgi:hypothetical protein
MTKNPIFQMDINDPSSWLLYYALRDVFQHATPDNPEATFEAVQHVLDERNIEDLSVHPDSPRRHRPAYLDYPKEAFMDDGETPQPLKKADPANPPPAKDWSVLGR